METRAVFTFTNGPHDECDQYHVYKHWDGSPTGAAQFLTAAKALAWPLPRFEADEFAAAFVAANKKQAGDIRFTAGPEYHMDLEYRYVIESLPDADPHATATGMGADTDLRVRAFAIDTARKSVPIFDGTLTELAQHARTLDAMNV